uniref:ATP synthase subunit f, mitochondrial n=1 Tax=Lepeophtheirus salmonis TaxID=72036 RepID=C1BS67_LEPSM|nr:ATP synthase subunit f, mitochondrial [Lepeophtheirus salmonis]
MENLKMSIHKLRIVRVERFMSVVVVLRNYELIFHFLNGRKEEELEEETKGEPSFLQYYGKKDTKFSDLKLKEVPGWLSRRNKSPVAFGRALSRGYWRWGHKYYFPRNAGVAPLLQAVILTSFVSYLVNYSKISHHKNRKYHW